MRVHIGAATTKGAVANLLYRYDMGVPSLECATRSAGNTLTLVDQTMIHSYERRGNPSNGKSCEMNLYRLP